MSCTLELLPRVLFMFPEQLTSKPVAHIHLLWFLLLHGEKKIFCKVLREDTSAGGSSVKVKTQVKTACLSIVPNNRDKDSRDSSREQIHLGGQQEVTRYFDSMWIFKNVKSQVISWKPKEGAECWRRGRQQFYLLEKEDWGEEKRRDRCVVLSSTSHRSTKW